jgi:taurine dioxygenase
VPATGGNTLFANCTAAYDALPADIKARIAGRAALNVYDYNADPTHRTETMNWEAPHWAHPVVRTHPETGNKALYVCRLMSWRIEDMEQAESDELLSYLFDHMEQPEFVYEHVWRVGELIMWDNRCSVHARTHFEPTARRMMRRITTKGLEPVV